MIAGLRLPFMSEADPEVAAEGGIDPLGLSSLADRLADEIAPGLTARMQRVRYLTVMCAAAAVLERFADRVARDGTAPYLVLEWIIVDGFARRGADLPSDGRQIPGIDKARAAQLRGEPMSARNYLKTPKVFGFHGVYRTLAEALKLVTTDGVLRERGEALARTWEREQGLQGFVDRTTGVDGGKWRTQIEEALEKSLARGSNEVPGRARLNEDLVRVFRPNTAGPKERELLRGYLLDAGEPIRREVFMALADHSPGEDEVAYVQALMKGASARLGARLTAIQRFEEFSACLTSAFDRFAYLSSQQGTKPVTANRMASDERFADVAAKVTPSARRTAEALGALDTVSLREAFHARFSKFEEPLGSASFFSALLSHHGEVQRRKPPAGKRPWYEAAGEGYVIRTPYRLWDPPERDGTFVHPFRIQAMLRFLEDLK